MNRRRSRWRRLSVGWYCDHRGMRSAPCAPCRRRGQRCALIECPACGLWWDPTEAR